MKLSYLKQTEIEHFIQYNFPLVWWLKYSRLNTESEMNSLFDLIRD